jgi:hypothetical protein
MELDVLECLTGTRQRQLGLGCPIRVVEGCSGSAPLGDGPEVVIVFASASRRVVD